MNKAQRAAIWRSGLEETIDNRFFVGKGRMEKVCRYFPDDTFDSVVTDPPYHLTTGKKGGSGPASVNLDSPYGRARVGTGFMGMKWDGGDVSMRPETWAECYRVLKPGGYLFAFGGTRTFHRIACAIEDAGFEIRDCLSWMYGCLSEDTEVLVDGRWEHYSKATPGRHVLAYDPADDTYQWEQIQDQVVYEYDDTAFRVESDRTDQIVSRNHRCLVEREGRWEFRFAETCEREEVVPVLESMSGSQAVRGEGRTVADMARITPFHYVGKVWCIRVPSGAFVARRNGKVFVTGNSGFPKSMDVSKAIDKALGAERKRVAGSKSGGMAALNKGNATKGYRDKAYYAEGNLVYSNEAVTDEAAQWSGWGTALKPAWEPIILARKPLSERTVAANVLKHGTGGMNIDACRIGTSKNVPSSVRRAAQNQSYGDLSKASGDTSRFNPNVGRWPANVVLDEVAAGMLDAKTGTLKSAKATKSLGQTTPGSFGGGLTTATNQYGDSGGASRFFYISKCSKRERNAGLPDGMVNAHPTVKPIELMRWLCRLVTPRDGLILDPFCGSGSTLCAAVSEGFRAVGIDMAGDYPEVINVARLRTQHWLEKAQ